MIKTKFASRDQAGRRLAKRIRPLLKRGEDAFVISLPRGGVPVGLAIARELKLAHDIIMTRRIAEEAREEWSVGAVADDGSLVWSERRKGKERPAYLKRAVAKELKTAQRRLKLFRPYAGKAQSMKGRTVIIADDGAARGWTMLSAIAEGWERGATRVIAAVPVASRIAARRFRKAASRLVSLKVPERFYYVSSYYAPGAFVQVPDEEVKQLLAEFKRGR
jgi:putative phosphoribosyl transferase